MVPLARDFRFTSNLLLSTAKILIIVGASIKLVDLLNCILDPGSWIFDNFLDKNHDGLLDV
jgi:hypothetical protein